MSEYTAHDSLAEYNRQRWNELAHAGIEFSRPLLDLNPVSARRFLDPYDVMRQHNVDLSGKQVLCLAAGGGQQSIAFTLLGAHATVFDLSDTMLERDRQAAAHHNMQIRIEQGDMRDLSRFADASFDIVYHAYSINFVPDIRPVLAEVARVLRPRGLYRIEWHNPFTQAVDETTWTGRGYLLEHLYQNGRDLTDIFPHWDVTAEDNTVHRIHSPKSFVHSLGHMINTLAAHGFIIRHCSEYTGAGEDMTPGSWDHYMAVTAPWITLWALYRPDIPS